MAFVVVVVATGSPDHGKHGPPTPSSPTGRVPEPHDPAGYPADAPWLPAGLCP